jgi:hypothetical protein
MTGIGADDTVVGQHCGTVQSMMSWLRRSMDYRGSSERGSSDVVLARPPAYETGFCVRQSIAVLCSLTRPKTPPQPRQFPRNVRPDGAFRERLKTVSDTTL